VPSGRGSFAHHFPQLHPIPSLGREIGRVHRRFGDNPLPYEGQTSAPTTLAENGQKNRKEITMLFQKIRRSVQAFGFVLPMIRR
jgi:hypothetical protein